MFWRIDRNWINANYISNIVDRGEMLLIFMDSSTGLEHSPFMFCGEDRDYILNMLRYDVPVLDITPYGPRPHWPSRENYTEEEANPATPLGEEE